MSLTGWTRFSRADMQLKLIELIRVLGLDHCVERDTIRTRDEDYYIVDSLREAVREWAIGSHHCFRGREMDALTYDRYRAFMDEHGIPYVEEDSSEGRWFILREEDDPYEWGVEQFVRP